VVGKTGIVAVAVVAVEDDTVWEKSSRLVEQRLHILPGPGSLGLWAVEVPIVVRLLRQLLLPRPPHL
jgi:hypothetical protein